MAKKKAKKGFMKEPYTSNPPSFAKKKKPKAKKSARKAY